jgi:hypothetical protein
MEKQVNKHYMVSLLDVTRTTAAAVNQKMSGKKWATPLTRSGGNRLCFVPSIRSSILAAEQTLQPTE